MKNKYLLFSLDGGSVYDRKLVQLFRRYGMTGTFHLSSGLLGQPQSMASQGLVCTADGISAKQVASLYAGQELAARGQDFCPLCPLSDAEIRTQTEEDRRVLRRLAQKSVIGFSYPCGAWDARVKQIVKEETGICYARTMHATHTFASPTDFYTWDPTAFLIDDAVFSLAEDFCRTEEEAVFLLCGSALETELFHGWDRLDALLRTLAFRPEIASVGCGTYCALQLAKQRTGVSATQNS